MWGTVPPGTRERVDGLRDPGESDSEFVAAAIVGECERREATRDEKP